MHDRCLRLRKKKRKEREKKAKNAHNLKTTHPKCCASSIVVYFECEHSFWVGQREKKMCRKKNKNKCEYTQRGNILPDLKINVHTNLVANFRTALQRARKNIDFSFGRLFLFSSIQIISFFFRKFSIYTSFCTVRPYVAFTISAL